MAKTTKKAGRKTERIIWTLDLLDFKVAQGKKQVAFAESLFPDRSVEIQPAFVFRDIRSGQSQHYKWCVQLFKKFLGQIRRKAIRPGKIVTKIPHPYKVRANFLCKLDFIR